MLQKLILPNHVRRAIQCGPVPTLRAWRKLPVEKLTRAERCMAFCESYLVVPEGDLVGKPVVLDVYQEAFFYAVFDNKVLTKKAFLSIARKNAKTATIAMIVLCFILGPEARQSSRIVSGAMSREQAAEVYNYASKMVILSADITPLARCIPSAKKIIGLSKNVEYQAISAEGRTAHGKSPLIAILDEVGQVRGPQSDFVDAIITAQGAYSDAMLFAISTQAPNDADLFSVWLDDAKASADPRIVSHLYCADPDCQISDREQWYFANPALGKFRSLPDFEEQADRAARMPSSEPTFRNLLLNQRVETVSPFISKGVWIANSGTVDDSVFYEREVFVGLDLSGKTDLTSLVLIAADDDRVHVRPIFWTPEKGLRDRAKRDRAPYDVWHKDGFLRTTPGASIDYESVAQDIADAVDGMNIVGAAFDRWRIDLLKKEFDRIGLNLPLVEWGQGFKDMAPAIDNLEELLLNDGIAHGGHPVLTMCMANARVEKDAAGNRKLNKAKATGRIDGAVALAMAVGLMRRNNDEAGSMQGFLSNPILG
jgi:phage terminase large subunit-like protein